MMPRDRQRSLHHLEHLPGHRVAALAVQRARRMRRGDCAHHGSEVRSDDHLGVVGTDSPVDFRRARRIDTEEERYFEPHDQPLGRGHRRLLFHLLRAHGHLGDAFQRVDDVNAFVELFTGDLPEERGHADVACRDRTKRARRRQKCQDEDQDGQPEPPRPARLQLDHHRDASISAGRRPAGAYSGTPALQFRLRCRPPSSPGLNRRAVALAVLVAALGYFVDIYDLILFSIVRVRSLTAIGVPPDQLLAAGRPAPEHADDGDADRGDRVGHARRSARPAVGAVRIDRDVFGRQPAERLRDDGPAVRSACASLAGIGLAGELGAGITLVSEIMPRESRGYATTLVAAVGICGAVVAVLRRRLVRLAHGVHRRRR